MRSHLGVLWASLAVGVALTLVTGCGTDFGWTGGAGDGGTDGRVRVGGGSSGSGGGGSSGVGSSGSTGGGSGGTSSGAGSSGASGGGSGGNGSSSSGGNGSSGSQSGLHRVFVTSSTFSGDLGGASGADAKCATAAEAAQLGGAWKAWISTSNVNAIDRIADNGPWYLVDGVTRVFNNKANLLTSPLVPIFLDENGNAWQGGGLYGTWSGSDDQGVRDTNAFDDACVDWTSASNNDQATAGNPELTSQEWGGGGSPLPCDGTNSLFCFEQ